MEHLVSWLVWHPPLRSSFPTHLSRLVLFRLPLNTRVYTGPLLFSLHVLLLIWFTLMLLSISFNLPMSSINLSQAAFLLCIEAVLLPEPHYQSKSSSPISCFKLPYQQLMESSFRGSDCISLFYSSTSNGSPVPTVQSSNLLVQGSRAFGLSLSLGFLYFIHNVWTRLKNTDYAPANLLKSYPVFKTPPILSPSYPISLGQK